MARFAKAIPSAMSALVIVPLNPSIEVFWEFFEALL